MTALLLLALAAASPLTAEEARQGTILLFDGETTFGWRAEGEVKAEKGMLVLGGAKRTVARHPAACPGYTLSAEVSTDGKAWGTYQRLTGPGGTSSQSSGPVPEGFLAEAKDGGLSITVEARQRLYVRNVKYRPDLPGSLFDGKSLAGWKVFKGDPKREKSKFTVEEGELRLKDGPGDLQSEKLLGDFVLHAEVKVNGKGLNSGIFFRCIPGEYQNGYEAQIHNDFSMSPPRKYVINKAEVLSPAKDFGTGAIYRRVPARKASAKDGEWFTMTILARGRHLSTWVNGIQQVDWTDDRPAHDNPRTGYRAKAGAVSLQGHDPTTDLSFRNIRYAELPGGR
jgi:hypothetical protein